MRNKNRKKEVINSKWEYHNHAYIFRAAPHMKVDSYEINSKKFWRVHKKPSALLARWVENFDCKEETEWWHTILDKPFDLMQLKSKRRCVVKQGINNFDVKEIEFGDYIEAIAEVKDKAYADYPKKYRPNFKKDVWIKKQHSNEEKQKFYGAFHKGSGELCGFLSTKQSENCIFLMHLKSKPEFEKYQVNAGLIAKFLYFQKDFIMSGGYISNCERNIFHETAFNNYLEKYFFFRKAYCELRIKYKKIIKAIVNLLYPLRRVFLKFDNIGIVHRINGVLKMEEIVRRQKNKQKKNNKIIN